jgi:hypothetical protein
VSLDPTTTAGCWFGKPEPSQLQHAILVVVPSSYCCKEHILYDLLVLAPMLPLHITTNYASCMLPSAIHQSTNRKSTTTASECSTYRLFQCYYSRRLPLARPLASSVWAPPRRQRTGTSIARKSQPSHTRTSVAPVHTT